MPVGRREMTEEERYYLARLSEYDMLVGGPDWRLRRDLRLATADDKISQEHARHLRTLVGRYCRKKYHGRVRAQRFAASPIGAFPYAKRERA